MLAVQPKESVPRPHVLPPEFEDDLLTDLVRVVGADAAGQAGQAGASAIAFADSAPVLPELEDQLAREVEKALRPPRQRQLAGVLRGGNLAAQARRVAGRVSGRGQACIAVARRSVGARPRARLAVAGAAFLVAVAAAVGSVALLDYPRSTGAASGPQAPSANATVERATVESARVASASPSSPVPDRDLPGSAPQADSSPRAATAVEKTVAAAPAAPATNEAVAERTVPTYVVRPDGSMRPTPAGLSAPSASGEHPDARTALLDDAAVSEPRPVRTVDVHVPEGEAQIGLAGGAAPAMPTATVGTAGTNAAADAGEAVAPADAPVTTGSTALQPLPRPAPAAIRPSVHAERASGPRLPVARPEPRDAAMTAMR
ncbi:hypothetical protein ACUN0C_11505 [Faunimonas sp. B44]|uniref:hypothetical protein n=1 Tax=Faunimonas sp. B44 TaxID=3461493 RepID=UPI00404421E2